MSPTIGHISVPITKPGQFEIRPYSDYLTKLIDQVSSLGRTYHLSRYKMYFSHYEILKVTQMFYHQATKYYVIQITNLSVNLLCVAMVIYQHIIGSCYVLHIISPFNLMVSYNQGYSILIGYFCDLTSSAGLVSYMQETRRIVDEAYSKAEQLLKDNRSKLDKVKTSAISFGC